MRSCWLVVVAGCFFTAAAFRGSVAQEPKAATPTPEPSRRIVPVVALKPGETKELLMCASCRLFTRGGGLIIRSMSESNDKQERTLWKKDGVAVEVPSMGAAAQAADAPAYKPLSDKGLSAFVVTVSAAKDAKPRQIEMHLADETCSGTCDTDFRVLVLAP
jgi:hypothetical protein